MNTDNLTDREIALYLKECVEDDNYDEDGGFEEAAMEVVRDPDVCLSQLFRRVESRMIKEGADREVYDRVNQYRCDLLDLMDAEIDDLEAELSEVEG